MAAFLVTYDLNQPGQKYDAVHELLKTGFSNWAKILESTWIVITDESAHSIHQKLRAITDDSDRFLVVRIDGADRQGWLAQSSWKWINAAVPR